MTNEKRPLKVFLCHSSHDKSVVRELYQRLMSEGWIDPWLDEEKLYPGQDWDLEIEKAVESADAVIVCLSNNSVSKEGYLQRELRFVLRISDYKPEGTVFVVPVRLDGCNIPRRLEMWHYVDYFPEDRKDWAYQRLLGGLKARATKLEIAIIELVSEKARRNAEEKAIRSERANFTVTLRSLPNVLPTKIENLKMRLEELGYVIEIDIQNSDSNWNNKGNWLGYGHPDCLVAFQDIYDNTKDIVYLSLLKYERFDYDDESYENKNLVIQFTDSALFKH